MGIIPVGVLLYLILTPYLQQRGYLHITYLIHKYTYGNTIVDLYICRRRYAVICIYPYAPMSAYSVACVEKGWWWQSELVRSYTLGKYILIFLNGKMEKNTKPQISKKEILKNFLASINWGASPTGAPVGPYLFRRIQLLGVYLVISPTFSFSQEV